MRCALGVEWHEGGVNKGFVREFVGGGVARKQHLSKCNKS